MRFSEDMHLPSDLIHGPLGLKSACFEPSCSPDPTRQNATLRKVVDDSGQNIGFGKPISTMLEQLAEAGARIVYNARLVSIVEEPSAGVGSMRLRFRGTHSSEVVVSSVILNLPRNALLGLSPESLLFSKSSAATRERLDCADNSKLGKQKMAVKGYLSYPEAWWLTRLNLTEGRRELVPTENQSLPLIQARYHGASSAACASASLEGRSSCPGVLEIVDDFELGCGSDYGKGVCWYLQFWQDRDNAFQRLRLEDSSAVAVVHEKLLELHSKDLAAAGVDISRVPPPSELYLGLWLADSPLQPVPRMLGDNGPADYACLHGEDPTVFLDRLRAPLEDYSLLIANNDFTYSKNAHDGDWAWASLASVERLMHEHLTLAAPEWLNEKYYRDTVLHGSTSQMFMV
jgi:hypothetical protein